MKTHPNLRDSDLPPASYDLHLHTYWSYDATAEPEMHFRRAAELGVRCIAITEHHNIDSAEEVRGIAEKYPDVQLIVAAELTVTTSFGSIDLLCYNLPRNPSGTFAEVLDEYHEWQRAAGAARSRGMQALGYDYSDKKRLELLQSYRPARVIERQGATHVQNGRQVEYFIDQGYFTSREDYAARGNIPAPPYPAVERVIPAVKEAGGIVVIAHPFNYFLQNDVARMDALRDECQLDGIECAHRMVPPELTKFYRDYCEKYDLISTGGSDSHNPEDIVNQASNGQSDTEPRFARHLGEDAWLEEFLERIES
jgi:predicted metal-dependent phosphoesterase TrpH